jgi:hypothetical protein
MKNLMIAFMMMIFGPVTAMATPQDNLRAQAPNIKRELMSDIDQARFSILGDALPVGQLTSILSTSVLPSDGYSTFFIGYRKDGVAQGDFASRLDRHVRFVASRFQGRGLLSYFAYATSDYEVAIMTWESEAVMNKAFKAVGQSVLDDASQFIDTLVWGAL